MLGLPVSEWCSNRGFVVCCRATLLRLRLDATSENNRVCGGVVSASILTHPSFGATVVP